MPRILIVDDEPKIAELINKYATFEGYDTVEVNVRSKISILS